VAWLLVRLKLRLLRNALRGSRQARTSFIASCVFAAVLAVLMFVGLAAQRGQSEGVDVATTTFTSLAFGWLIIPLLVFGLDGTLDPATLALYPLRTRPLAVGLLAASAAGAWPLANVIGLLGVTVGVARGALGVLFALVAIMLQVLFCIVLARAVTTSMAGLLRSRRGKDFAALLIIPIFALYEAFVQLVPRLTSEGKINEHTFDGIDKVLRWMPPGLAAHAIQDASTGHALTGLARLALLAAIVVLLGAVWIRSLDRALVTADATTQATAVRTSALPFARHGLRGTVAARALVYQRREPGAKIFWGIVMVIMAATAVSTVRTPAYLGGLIGSAVIGAAFVGIFNADAIGMTGPAFGFDAMALHSRQTWRDYFAGLDLVLIAIAVPLMALVSFILAFVAGHPTDGFIALAVDLAGAGVGAGMGNMMSVMLPYPVERRVGSPAPKAIDGYRGEVVGAALGILITTAVLMVPVILAGVLTRHDPAVVRLPALLVGAALYGLAFAVLFQRMAARIAAEKLPELCEIAFRSKI
jgi:ABC-2 type transport system permease protein